MNLSQTPIPRVRDELPSLPMRKRSLDADRALWDDEDNDAVDASSFKSTSQGLYGKRSSNEEKLMQWLKDASMTISDGCQHHFESLSPISDADAILGRPRNSATRRSGAPHKGTKKADFLASLSKPNKPSNQRPKDVIQPAQRAGKSPSTRRTSSSSLSLKSSSNHEVRRWSLGQLPTITEYQKCSFRKEKGPPRQRKASSCDDLKQRRKSSRSKEDSKSSHRNATFESKPSQKSMSLLSPRARKSIQNTVLDPSLFLVDNVESGAQSASKSAHSRLISWDDESVDENEDIPTPPSSTRGVFEGAKEADVPRLPIRKKSERSIGL